MFRKIPYKVKSFKAKVLTVVTKIPKGETVTYKEVASRAGNKNAYRAVGNILRSNYHPNIPCHRVVGSNGRLGGYNRGVKRKIILLQKEGCLLSCLYPRAGGAEG